MHIDAMAVAVINDHKTAHKHSSFALFQAYDNTSVSLRPNSVAYVNTSVSCEFALVVTYHK